ncbi:MAG: fimbria/pilus outer membrane usher protein [Syntrophales bacterium]|nr:fimbria/pilus outer membrane usher protein [Syntrophales bacterium]
MTGKTFFLIGLCLSVLLISAFPADAVAAETASAPAGAAAKKPEKGPAPPSSLSSTTSIVVSVTVNTVPKGDIFAELDDRHNLYLGTEDAKTLKLQYAERQVVVVRGDEAYVPLGALLDVTSTFDEQKLTLTIVGKTTESGRTAVDLFSLQSSAKNIYHPRETSAFLNYGVNYYHSSSGGRDSYSVTNKLGLSSHDVFFTSDSLYTSTGSEDKFTRLQSSATYERRDQLQWVVFGDQYANSGELGSTLNMGGIGLSKVYRLDPFFITQPVLDLKGSVIFPTQAEIYMDGVLIGRQAIAPGSFDLKNIYSNTGSHNIEVLLKDPFGNVQKITHMAYFSTQLLREGLHEYSYNAGFLRQQYGVESNRYDKPAFSFFHNYGVSNSLNIGAHAEGADGIYDGGASVSFLVPGAGSFTAALAGSTGDEHRGAAGSLHHSYQLGSFNTNILLRAYSRDYATVATASSSDRSKYELNLGAGLLLNPFGTFTLSYSRRDLYDNSTTSVISGNYSRNVTRTVSLFATASYTLSPESSYSCFVGFNFELGSQHRGSAQASVGSGGANSQTLQVQKDMPVGEGLGYRASANRTETQAGRTTSYNPYVQYNAKYGIYSLNATINDASQGGSAEFYDLSAAGSIVYAGGFLGLSRPVSDSFGIVTVGDKVAGATVLKDGQYMGKTGSSGQLVVPSLTSYGRNQVTLDAKSLPLDYSLSGVNMLLSPSLWSGACVAFEAQQLRAVTGTLLLGKDGEKIPLEYVGISLRVGEKTLVYPTGKGGEFYMENGLPEEPAAGGVDPHSCRAIAERKKTGGNVIPPGTYRASVDYGGRRYEFSIAFPKTEEAITDLGEIYCNATRNAPPEQGSIPQPPSRQPN